jgi:UDP-GlcNAc:undecaprenyl-phosphate GlcNAc-1-phosphate transferase
MTYLFLFIVACGLTWLTTCAVRAFARAHDITDKPTVTRKIHKKPIPLLGGIAVYGALVLCVLGYLFFAPSSWPQITDSHVTVRHILGILLAGFFLMIGGFLDDVYNLKPYQQIIWPILATLTVIASGIGVEKITNPFGGYIVLHSAVSDSITFLWLLIIIYTTKFLDGLDGLVSGMVVINAVIIAFLSLFFFVNIPTVILSVYVAGCFAGFLIWNFHPAKIFLGEAGSTLAGFLLGVLAIISGAKFATTLLILGIPILDGIRVIFRRMIIERRSPFQADKKHIHFRLLDVGFSVRTAVFILYAIAALCGVLALFLQSSQKLYALSAVGIGMMILVFFLMKREKRSVR